MATDILQVEVLQAAVAGVVEQNHDNITSDWESVPTRWYFHFLSLGRVYFFIIAPKIICHKENSTTLSSVNIAEMVVIVYN